MANTDGYGIEGKFSSDTGVSGAKKKGNYKGLGYKGETKTSPKETKSYGGGWIGLLGDMMTMDANASRAFKNTMALCLVDNGWGVRWKR